MEKKSIKEVLKVLSQPETKKRLRMVVINHHQEDKKVEAYCDITLQNPTFPTDMIVLKSSDKNDFCNELYAISCAGSIPMSILKDLFDFIGYDLNKIYE